MKTIRITAHCLSSCGLLASGLTSDPPTTSRPRKATWTRWDEIDDLAEKHPHATAVSGDPA